MLENALRMRTEEEERSDSFRTRAGQLAGFGGVFLALLGALLGDTFDGLNDAVCVVAKAFLVGAVAAVTGSIYLALIHVVRPLTRPGISPQGMLNRYLATPGLLRARSWEYELRVVRSLPRELAWMAWVNQRQAGALYLASVLMASGLLATAVCLVILALGG